MLAFALLSVSAMKEHSEPLSKWTDENGVFLSDSTDLTAEIFDIAGLLSLRPGVRYCEIGGGDGLHMSHLGPLVLPGGDIAVTSPKQEELDAMASAAREAGFTAHTHLATDTVMGLTPNSCDAILVRMVYHMLKPVVATNYYLPQIHRALRPDGRVLILDHNPEDACINTRENATLMGTMPVVPLLQEVREFTAAGFALLRMRDRWEYFQTKPPGGDEHGYALLFRDAAGCGENPFAAAPASAVAGWVILLLVCLLLANCAGTCILLGRTRRRRAELKRSASGEDEVLFVDT